jgi:hypothetical protein
MEKYANMVRITSFCHSELQPPSDTIQHSAPHGALHCKPNLIHHYTAQDRIHGDTSSLQSRSRSRSRNTTQQRQFRRTPKGPGRVPLPTWRTSGSRSSRCSRTCSGPSCTCALSRGPEDRRGSDRSAGSRWTAAPEIDQIEGAGR